MNETVREMTFEEEYAILQKETDRLFEKEIEGCEPPFANCVVRRALRCIRKLLEKTELLRKKQDPHKIIHNVESGREYEDFICPYCGDILQQRRKGATAITVYHFKYCHNCGCHLDWGDRGGEDY